MDLLYEKIMKHREFMKECISGDLGVTDQMRGKPPPPMQREISDDSQMISLPDPFAVATRKKDVVRCIHERESRRKYIDKPVTLSELSYLLWATQGVRKVYRSGQASLRTVPSGGARHPFETYLAVNRVENLSSGVYAYLPLDHSLVYLFTPPDMPKIITEAVVGQSFVGHAPVVFIWSVIPYRGEWRYSISAHKTMLLDAGHVCQNLYIACESLEMGTCAIAAYSQARMDAFLKLDGSEEFTVYLAPVGHVKARPG